MKRVKTAKRISSKRLDEAAGGVAFNNAILYDADFDDYAPGPYSAYTPSAYSPSAYVPPAFVQPTYVQQPVYSYGPTYVIDEVYDDVPGYDPRYVNPYLSNPYVNNNPAAAIMGAVGAFANIVGAFTRR